MQKILAFLLLIWLINANGNGQGDVDVEINDIKMNVDEANTGTSKKRKRKIENEDLERIIKGEKEGDEAVLEQELGKFDDCMMNAKDDTDKEKCFTVSMKVFAEIGSEEEKRIAELAEKIIDCKKGEENTGECLRKASRKMEGKAKETMDFIGEELEEQKKIVKEVEEFLEKEQKEFDNNHTCEEVEIETKDGKMIKTQKCKPTETYQKILEDLQQKYEEEFDRVVQIDVTEIEIDGETQKINIYRPTPAAIKEQTARNETMVEELQKTLNEEGENKVTAEEKEIIEKIIAAIKTDTDELQNSNSEKSVEELKEKIKKEIETVNAALKKIEKQNALKNEEN